MLILVSFRDRILLGSPGWPWVQATLPALPCRVLGLQGAPPCPANMKHFNFLRKDGHVLEQEGISWQCSFLSSQLRSLISSTTTPALVSVMVQEVREGADSQSSWQREQMHRTDKGAFLPPTTDARISAPSQEVIVNAAADGERAGS